MKKTKTFYRVGVLCLCALFILSYHIPLGRAATYLDYLNDKIQNGYDIDTFSDTSDLINYEVDRMNQLQDLINTTTNTTTTFSGSTLQNTTTGTGTGTGGGVTTLGMAPPAPATLSAPPTMPTMPATATTDPNGVATIVYTSGTIFPTDLNDLWARVKYDGNTEYWDLDPSMLSTSGTFLTIQFNSTFNGKTVEMQFYGYDTTNAPTGFSNKVTIGPITSAASTVVMPTLPTPVTTDANGKITAIFTSGTLFGTQLQDLWARVKYDAKTEYWDLDKSMLAADGTSFTMQFNSTFDGKTVEMELYGYDTSGRQTSFTNIMNITVHSASSSVVMPTLPATGNTNAIGKINIAFTSGTLFYTQLNDLWARVKYDAKTEYWDLDPSMLAADGLSLNMQFTSAFDTKVVRVEFYGYDTTGKQTSFTNPIDITVSSSPSGVTMPTVPGSQTTDATGKITVTFTSGTLLPASINDLWARVTFDSKTEYWDLDKSMLATDGKSLTMQFNSLFHGKVVKTEFYAFDTLGKQTDFTNAINITVDSSPSTVVMPTLPAAQTTDPNGKITITFTSGTLLPTSITDLWARVTYDGKTEYWDLTTSLLAADGKSLTMQFNSSFHGKVVKLEFYGYDGVGKQTAFTNPINVTVNSSPSTVTMPTLPAGPVTTDPNGKITLTFTAGTLLPTSISDLWARVTYDGTIEYWDLDPGMLSAAGTSFAMQFNSAFHGKTVKLELFAYDLVGKQTLFTNFINIVVDSSPSAVSMPDLPVTATTDPNGKVTLVFTSGTLLPANITDLWARVNYDGKTEYWDLDKTMLSAGGTSFTIQFNSSFHGKVVNLQLYAYDTLGKQTAFTNQSQITVDSSPSTVVMPTLPASQTTDPNGKITITFTAGTLLPTSLTDLWAKVSYDGKTEYWDLDTGMLNVSGTQFSMQFTSAFHGKTVKLELFGYDTVGKQTLNTNSINITVNSSPSAVTMPTLPATGTTDPNGKIIIAFTGGTTLLPASLTDLWARVQYDGKTEYWDLSTALLAVDGTTLTIQFNNSFHGKHVIMEFYGFDTLGKQTAFMTPIDITVNSSPSLVIMPTLPGTGATDVNGKLLVTFTSGTLLPTSLTGFWARVNYDGKTEYWDLGTAVLAADGKSLSMLFTPAFDNKTVKLEFFGYDTTGKQTLFSNQITVTVDSNLSPLAMPTLPGTGTTDANGKITVTFTAGTLLRTSLTDLWARVTYDPGGGLITEFWDLDPAMLNVAGTSFTIQFNNTFHGKVVKLELFGFDAIGKQTNFTNFINITVNSSPSAVTMPTLPATGTTDANGKIVVTYASGTLTYSQLNDLWARVTYDGKTEYWDLDPAMLTTPNTFTMQFSSAFHGKVVRVELFGYDTVGKQTTYTNFIDITVNSSPSAVLMPTLPGTGTTDANGKIIVTFTAGTLLPTNLSDLWARVQYDGKTEYWNLDPSMLNSTGTTFTIQFGSSFHGKVVRLELYGYDTGGKQTLLSNAIDITVNSSPSTLVMPTLPNLQTTNPNGKITINFTSGTLLASSITDLWARVNYDGKTEYWDLDPAMLSISGTAFTMQFSSAFHTKTVKLELFAYDTVGKQTSFTNAITITVDSSPSGVAMPTLPAGPTTTDVNGKITLTFTAGTLLPTSINDLWARVNYDGKTEYWDLDPAMLNASGTNFTMQFNSTFHGKVVKIELFAYDPLGKQTAYSNQSIINVNSSPSAVIMPTLPAGPTATDVNGKVTLTFTSGTLLPTSITDLWARVNYDGKTEYWDLDPSMLSVAGTTFSMQFGSTFHGKTVKIELFAYDTIGKQTLLSNQATITVNSSPSTVTMPTLPAGPTTTDVNGKITLTFTAGTLLRTSLNDLWARVVYDGKTEYWDLDTTMLNVAGTQFSIQFSSAFHSKTIKLELFGYDTVGKQTLFTNQTTITVNSSPSGVTMPTLPAGPTTTDPNGKITLTFTAGTLLPANLNDLWARVNYDGKTEYWDLDPAMLNVAGTQFSMQFSSAFHGKTVKLELFGYDTVGKQTLLSNQTTINVDSSPSAVAMPTLPAGPTTTNTTGKITITFSAGTLLPTSLTDLWARVNYDGKTEYWDLDPAMLNTSGTNFTIQFNSTFHGKTVKLELYGFDTLGKQTVFSNQTTINVDSSASTVTMPTLPGTGSTDGVGKITITFTAGTLPRASINDLWARVTYDGKIEYWDLDPSMLSVIGDTFSIQFSSPFNGKTVKMELFAYDTAGKQTLFSNPINISVTSQASTVAMPVLPGTSGTADNGKVTLYFVSGTLTPSQLKELWGRVTYDGKIEYWKLDPGMLSTGGSSITMQFDNSFNGKTVKVELYGYDTLDRQTTFTNPVNITVTSLPPIATMPVIPGTGTTNAGGAIQVTFTSGTLFAAQLNDLWARVRYDGKTEYWNLDPGMLAADGLSLYMQFDPAFHGKTVIMEFYGYDTLGRQTAFTNAITITVL